MEIIEAIQEKKTQSFPVPQKILLYHAKTEHYRHLMVEEVKNHCKIIGSLTEITEPCMKVAVYEREGMTEDPSVTGENGSGIAAQLLPLVLRGWILSRLPQTRRKGFGSIRNFLALVRKNAWLLVMNIMI